MALDLELLQRSVASKRQTSGLNVEALNQRVAELSPQPESVLSREIKQIIPQAFSPVNVPFTDKSPGQFLREAGGATAEINPALTRVENQFNPIDHLRSGLRQLGAAQLRPSDLVNPDFLKTFISGTVGDTLDTFTTPANVALFPQLIGGAGRLIGRIPIKGTTVGKIFTTPVKQIPSLFRPLPTSLRTPLPSPVPGEAPSVPREIKVRGKAVTREQLKTNLKLRA